MCVVNFLAHLLLACERPRTPTEPWPGPAVLVGSLLPDLVRGHYRGPMSAALRAGYDSHLLVDRLTDRHPAFARSREALRPTAGRFAPVLVDVIYDHCLARQWSAFCDLPLQTFCRYAHADIGRFFESDGTGVDTRGGEGQTLPEGVQRVGRMLAAERWLDRYHTPEGLELTLAAMAHRFTRRFRRPVDLSPVIAALPELIPRLDPDLAALFGDLVAQTRTTQTRPTP